MIAATLALSVVAAQGYPKEGKFDLTTCHSGTSNVIQISSTSSANSGEWFGNTRSNPPGGFLDMTSYHCLSLGANVNGKSSSSYYCEGADKDGDKYMSHGSSEGSKTNAEVIAGTGKYDGMVRTGIAESLGTFPTIKPGTFTACSHQTGTYKLR